MSKSVWHVSRRFWKRVLPITTVFSLVVLVSGGTWWVALLLSVLLPVAVYMARVRDNMEWEGYVSCKTCRGTGRIKET